MLGRARIAVGLVGVALALSPAVALAQGPSNPLSPGLPASPITTPTQTTPPIANPTTASSPGSSGLSGGAAIGIAIGAIVLLVGISFFIWRDARRRAPIKHHAAHADAGVGARSGSKRPPKPRKLSPAERRRRKRGRAK
jgi:hypothetical protein